MTFRKRRLQELGLPAATVRLMVEIAESKGLQKFYEKQNSPLLRALRAAAFVRSIESSNRIAGITVQPDRLPLVAAGHEKPRNRSEELIRGYAQAHSLVYKALSSQVDTDFVRRLHEIALKGANDAGQWKVEENETLAESRTAKYQTGSVETATAMEELCVLYKEELTAREVHPLLAAGAFIFDFIRIHPFREGNGRVSRLLVQATLYSQGFEVGRYASLERLIEVSWDNFRDALGKSSEGWDAGKHDLIPWLNYFFGVVRQAYLELDRQAREPSSHRSKKTPLVEVAIDSLPSEFTLVQLERTCPGVSRETIRRVLRQLRKGGILTCVRRGSMTAWQKTDELFLPLKLRTQSEPPTLPDSNH